MWEVIQTTVKGIDRDYDLENENLKLVFSIVIFALVKMFILEILFVII